MPLRDHLFVVTPPVADASGWHTAVCGENRVELGPYATERDAIMGLHHLFQRWRLRAKRRGGFLWRQTAWRWVVTLPPDVPCTGLPFVSEACTRAVASGEGPATRAS